MTYKHTRTHASTHTVSPYCHNNSHFDYSTEKCDVAFSPTPTCTWLDKSKWAWVRVHVQNQWQAKAYTFSQTSVAFLAHSFIAPYPSWPVLKWWSRALSALSLKHPVCKNRRGKYKHMNRPNTIFERPALNPNWQTIDNQFADAEQRAQTREKAVSLTHIICTQRRHSVHAAVIHLDLMGGLFGPKGAQLAFKLTKRCRNKHTYIRHHSGPVHIIKLSNALIILALRDDTSHLNLPL